MEQEKAKTYSEVVVEDIKDHLEAILDYEDLDHMDIVDLIMWEHILYYNFIEKMAIWDYEKKDRVTQMTFDDLEGEF